MRSKGFEEQFLNTFTIITVLINPFIQRLVKAMDVNNALLEILSHRERYPWADRSDPLLSRLPLEESCAL